MNSASTKTRPAELNRDAITPMATRIRDVVRANNILHPAVDEMLHGRWISQLRRNVYRRTFGPLDSLEHAPSEIHHGKY